jgi:5,10-methylenetetrahydrofolate reductase|tara:strand:- start:95 stop:376 length:282 start_codon:yes stop_codon:yes gene_type:complete
MNKKEFEAAFNIFIDWEPSSDMDDAYDTYKDLVEQIAEGSDFVITQMFRMSEMNTQERLKWRMCLAEEGIEMTPTQVDEYIILLELALSQSDI